MWTVRRVLNLIESQRWFLYLGLALVFLSIVCFPAKIPVVVQSETLEVDLLWMGPFYSLLLGLWSLPNLLLGVLEYSVPRKKALPLLTPILLLANTLLAVVLWDQARYWRGAELRMLLSYSPFITPCLAVNAIGLLYAKVGNRLARALRNVKVRILLTVVFSAFPTSAVGWVLLSWWQVLIA